MVTQTDFGGYGWLWEEGILQNWNCVIPLKPFSCLPSVARSAWIAMLVSLKSSSWTLRFGSETMIFQPINTNKLMGADCYIGNVDDALMTCCDCLWFRVPFSMLWGQKLAAKRDQQTICFHRVQRPNATLYQSTLWDPRIASQWIHKGRTDPSLVNYDTWYGKERWLIGLTVADLTTNCQDW